MMFKKIGPLFFYILMLLIPALFSCQKTTAVRLDALPPNIVPAPPSVCPLGGILVNNAPVCNGNNGVDGASIGVITYPSQTCQAGGIVVEFFKDFNGDGVKNFSDYILSVSHVCNGLNGSNGVVNITPASPLQCPNGGILVNGYPVCNGLNGATSSSDVIAAKLCPADNDPMAEYGFIIGGELYAVLYSNQNSHPHSIGLVRVSPGTYVTTTTGTPKTFTYSRTSTHISLTCDSVTSTYPIAGNGTSGGGSNGGSNNGSGGSGSGSNGGSGDGSNGGSNGGSGSGSLNGVSCVVRLLHNYGDEKHYSTTVSGTGIVGDYKILYALSNDSYWSRTSCSSKGFWTNNTCSQSQYNFYSQTQVIFTPINNSASYTVYILGDSQLFIMGATLIKISTNETVQCIVINAAAQQQSQGG